MGLLVENSLGRFVADSIATSGPMPFDRYVDYWHAGVTLPSGVHLPGFYERKDLKIGNDYGSLSDQKVDFTTYPELTPIFGFMMAQHILDLASRMTTTKDFQIVEMGAGNGTLASDVMHGLKYYNPDFQYNYTIVERSSTLAAAQRSRLVNLPAQVIEGSAVTDLPQGVRGVFLSNELVDDLSSKVVLTTPQRAIQELFVGLGENDRFKPSWRQPTEGVEEYVAKYRRMPMGRQYTRAPVHMAGKEWLTRVANSLEEGFVITVDYPFDEYPHSLGFAGDVFIPHVAKSREVVRDNTGQMDCFSLENVGKGNITVPVDFTALALIGAEHGLLTTSDMSLTDFLPKYRPGQLIGELQAMPRERQLEILGGRELAAKYLGHTEFTDSFRVLTQRKVAR